MKSGDTYICDECGEEENYGGLPWKEVKEFYGWRAYKKDDKWFHACPDCVNEFARRSRKAGRPSTQEINPNKAYGVVLSALEHRGFAKAEAHMLILKAQINCRTES